MSVKPGAAATTAAVSTASWLPLIVVVLTQIQASFAVNALTVSMAGITTDLDTPRNKCRHRDHRGHLRHGCLHSVGGQDRRPLRNASGLPDCRRDSRPRNGRGRPESEPGNAVRGASCIRRRDRPHRSRVDGLHRHELQWRSAGKGHRLPGSSNPGGRCAGAAHRRFLRDDDRVAILVRPRRGSRGGQPDPELPGQTCSPAEGHHHRLGRRRHCCRCRHPAQLRFSAA